MNKFLFVLQYHVNSFSPFSLKLVFPVAFQIDHSIRVQAFLRNSNSFYNTIHSVLE
jgi:hypothetical protein